MKQLIRIVLYLWVSPNTAIGLFFGFLGICTGGHAQVEKGVVEFYGGFVSWLLSRIPPYGVMAMTLGHTIVGLNQNALHIAREHEHVHVRQYQRWGPLFIPAYLLSSLVLWLRKKDP